MGKSRSNNVMMIGVAVFAVGALLAFVGLRSGDKAVATPTNQQAAPASTPNASEVRTVPAAGAAGAAGAAAPVTFTVPKGKQAVAFELPSVPGLAGYAKPGDTVNIYATVSNGQPNGALKKPLSKLVLAAVKVLDVRAPLPGTAGVATYLLALDVNEAETVIFYAKFEALWIALTAPDQKPVTSAGRSYQNLL